MKGRKLVEEFVFLLRSRKVCEWNGGQQRQAKQSIEEIFDLFNWLVASVGPEWNERARSVSGPPKAIAEEKQMKWSEVCFYGAVALRQPIKLIKEIN